MYGVKRLRMFQCLFAAGIAIINSPYVQASSMAAAKVIWATLTLSYFIELFLISFEYIMLRD